MENNFPWSELLSIIDDVVKIRFEQFDAISVVHNSTCIDPGQLLSNRFFTVTLFRLSLFSYAVNRDALSATLETRGELHGAEMCPAIASGIVTADVSVSYWPIFFPFPRKLFGPVSSLLKRRMTVQVWNFVTFILILWDRFFSFRS